MTKPSEVTLSLSIVPWHPTIRWPGSKMNYLQFPLPCFPLNSISVPSLVSKVIFYIY